MFTLRKKKEKKRGTLFWKLWTTDFERVLRFQCVTFYCEINCTHLYNILQ